VGTPVVVLVRWSLPVGLYNGMALLC
jgi:hypothetical protein